MGARQPPKKEQPTRIVLKMLVVVILVLGVGIVIWRETTHQRIPLVERDRVAALGLDPDVLITVNGRTLYVVERTTGDVPVLLFHDVDIAGSVVFDDLVAAIDGDASAVAVDLPGFGLSQRIPEEGAPHTVAQMGRDLVAVIETRFDGPVVVAGVGLGGEVAAEIAATRPDLVSGLVMIDVDFWRKDGWRERSQRLPFVGKAMTFRHETSGGSAHRTWSPYCDRGGWCPSLEQQGRRLVTAAIVGSTDSVNSFHRTPRSSFVPDDLNLITAPTVYVWSSNGSVPRSSVDRIEAAIPGMTVSEVAVYQAHVEAADQVAAAIATVVSR